MFFTIGNDAYFLFASSNTFVKYNTVSDSWISLANFPGTQRFTGSGFSINGKGYITCGASGFGSPYLNDLWEFDPANNSWSQKSSLPATGRYATIAYSMNGIGYLLCGERYNPNTTLSEFWQYNPINDNWSQLTGFIGGSRNYLSGFVIGNNIYAGFGGFGYRSDFYLYGTLCTASISLASSTTFCQGGSVVLNANTGTGLTYQWRNNGNNISGANAASYNANTAGSYTVVVTDGNGCSATSTATTVTVNPTPTATITAGGSTTFCQGGSVVLNSNTGTGLTYQWRRNGSNISGATSASYTATTAGSYTVVVSSGTNCSATSSSVSVTVNPIPSAPQVSSNSPVTAGGTIQLNAATVSGATYSWAGPNGFSSAQQNPTIPNATAANSGSYSLTVRVNGCSSSASTTQVTVVPASGLFTLYLDTIAGTNGQQVLMPIRVKNFNNMLSAQFTLQFNSAVISYVGYQDAGIASINGSAFGTTLAGTGKITFAWSQPDVNPVSLPDDALLFNLKFNITGSGGSFSALTFTGSPTPIEFVDQTFVPLSNYLTLPGRVDVLSVSVVSGRLKTETGGGVRSADVTASGFTNLTTRSSLSGNYSLSLPHGANYVITPTKSNDTLVTNGITTLDVLLIRRHILGTQLLNSPYKIIAADVNQSSSITLADINLINALILANISTYPSTRTWAFVPDNHTFGNPQNPFPFPAQRSYASVSAPLVNQDFIGMKLGDVNNSYNPAQARLAASANAVELYIENQNVTQADTILVPVRVKNFSDISGFQFGLNWDAQVLRYIGINPSNGGLDVNKGEAMAEEGMLNVNWIDPNSGVVNLSDEDTLFTISFEVLGMMGTNSEVKVYSSTTAPVEITNGNLEVTEHLLESGIVSVTAASSIAEVMVSGLTLSAYPNPFAANATLAVESDIQRNAVLEIFDATGRMVSKESISLPQGSTSKTINLNQAAGNYLLVLSDIQSGLRLASLKLIKQ